jgi:hypothetical protein
MTVTVGGTAGLPQSLAAQLGYAGTNARRVPQPSPHLMRGSSVGFFSKAEDAEFCFLVVLPKLTIRNAANIQS